MQHIVAPPNGVTVPASFAEASQVAFWPPNPAFQTLALLRFHAPWTPSFGAHTFCVAGPPAMKFPIDKSVGFDPRGHEDWLKKKG